MKPLTSLFIIILIFFQSIGQENKTSNFPDSYFGIYTGDLIIHSDKGVKNYPMEFHLLSTDSLGIYNYMIVYGKDENRQERKYTLKQKSNEPGKYILDENNGILLDCKVVNNKMYFLFEVMDSLLTTFVTFYDDHLVFEIVMTNTQNKVISGGQEKDIPEVISYPIAVIQKAVLNKQ